DVAHGLAKGLPAQLPSQAEMDALPPDGSHPLWDRDEVHDIYAEWREGFNSYDPPRTAVAEAWVSTDRRPRYASAEGLGQAFNFDLLEADFDAAPFRRIITKNLDLAAASGSSTTWVLSNHDVVRHATRYGLPPRGGSAARSRQAGTGCSAAAPNRRWMPPWACSGPVPRRCWSWPCRDRRTCIRGRSSDCTRWPTSRTRLVRIRVSSAIPGWIWAETGAVSRSRGR